MYRFNLNSVDGNSVVDAHDLNEFAKDWTDGSLIELYRNGQHTTRDGITVISPADQVTKDAVEQKAISEVLRSSMKMSKQKFLDTALAMDRDAIVSLVAATTLSKGHDRYSETEFGRTFVLDKDDPLVDKFMPSKTMLEENYLQQGALYLKDTMVVVDDISGKAFVTDTRNEALTLEDMLPRQLEKGIVVNAEYSSFEGFDDDGIYADVRVSGDVGKVYKLKAMFEKMEADNEQYVHVVTKGFNNGPDNPLSNEEFVKLTYNHKAISLQEVDGNHRVRKNIVSPKMAMQAGSPEKGLWIKGNDGISTYVHGGSEVYVGYKKDDIKDDSLNVMWAKEVALLSSEFDPKGYQQTEQTVDELSFDELFGNTM
tara:strand:- start:45 stop:1151 length:1107 start_codon:yes stop_codon:yes gene_type:complete